MQPTVAPLASARFAAPSHQQPSRSPPPHARHQWDARLASFQRGLDHVMRCDAGDACGSSLCHATKRLMRSYATHDCTNPPGTSTTTTTTTANPTTCKVCKLWGYILTKHKAAKPAAARGGAAPPRLWHSPTLGVSSSPPVLPPVLPPLSCGLAHARAQQGAIEGIGGIGGIRGIGGIGGIGGMRGIGAGAGGARDARDARDARGAAFTRRAVVTPELIKIMAKRV